MIFTIVGGQCVFCAVQGEFTLGDAVGIAPHHRAQIIAHIGFDFVGTQNNVADVTVTIRRFDLHNSGTPGDELDSHTVAIV